MQWILALEAENNPIVLGRVLNALRRKGIVVITLVVETRRAELSLTALVASPKERVEHIANFLAGVAGVRNVTHYRRESFAVLWRHSSRGVLTSSPDTERGADFRRDSCQTNWKSTAGNS